MVKARLSRFCTLLTRPPEDTNFGNFGAMTRGYMMSINHLPESVLWDVWGQAKDIALKRCGAHTTLDKDSELDECALIFT